MVGINLLIQILTDIGSFLIYGPVAGLFGVILLCFVLKAIKIIIQ